MKRRLLHIDTAAQRWRLEILQTEGLDKDPREEYFVLSGEALCQYHLRRDPDALIIARGPMPFLSGNKTSVGYLSPLTGVPHYSFVGGRAAAQLLNLGLDVICFGSPHPEPSAPLPYVVIRGRAPNLMLTFKPADELPHGQRSAYYWLLDRELDGDRYAGSIFALGEGAYRGYESANVAVEAIYHAGRGGAGEVFARFASALVLSGEPVEPSERLVHADPTFARSPNAAIESLLDRYCARLSGKTGGTVPKLYATGADSLTSPTLPARNARQLGYALADLGSPRVLTATRQGQTGCHWCQVDCRHTHWVPAPYAPQGRDRFLDDFEPTYATFAMLDLRPDENTPEARLELLEEVDRRLMQPIEQLGCDVINVGTGLAALFEGVARGCIPAQEVPQGVVQSGGLEGDPAQRLEAAIEAVEVMRSPRAADYPALRAAANGPQVLADRYPAMAPIVFTSGPGTLGNAGHANALWTFLMPFNRFFGHYVGQLYKIDETLPAPGADEAAYRACFRRVIQRMLQKEFFWILCNALSQCAFTFVIFSQDGQGETLREDDLLVRLLRQYGIQTTRTDLEWFAQAFWAQSIDFKCQFGWQAPTAADLPERVYETLSLALDRTPRELQSLMVMLIEEWREQAGAIMRRFGYEPRF